MFTRLTTAGCIAAAALIASAATASAATYPVSGEQTVDQRKGRHVARWRAA